jgi:hypothetical protein
MGLGAIGGIHEKLSVVEVFSVVYFPATASSQGCASSGPPRLPARVGDVGLWAIDEIRENGFPMSISLHRIVCAS